MTDHPHHHDASPGAFERRGTAVLIAVHVIALFAGFGVLAAVFDFPEVLRLPSAERLALFRRERAIVQPTYWVLALTGLNQVAIAVFVHRALRARSATLAQLGLVFGVVCGVLQAAGFVRWAILIPYLADEMASADPTTARTIALLEGAFNRYAGMALGEHVANLCLGLWTILIGVALRHERTLDPRLGPAAIGLGAVALVLALEQLGVAPALLGLVLDFGFPAWAVWLVLLAVALWRSDGRREVRFGYGALAGALGLYALMVVPGVL